MTDTTTATWQPATTILPISAGPGASIPLGTRVRVAPVRGQWDTFYVDEERGRPPFLAARDAFRLGHSGPAPELEPRTWEAPAEPVGVETVWTEHAADGDPVRWNRVSNGGYGWLWESPDGGRQTWDRLLDHAPVTEYPPCEDIAPALADKEGGWPGPCTGWARNVDDVVDGRFPALYCPPCRIRAAADAAQDDPVQGPDPRPRLKTGDAVVDPGSGKGTGRVMGLSWDGGIAAVEWPSEADPRFEPTRNLIPTGERL